MIAKKIFQSINPEEKGKEILKKSREIFSKESKINDIKSTLIDKLKDLEMGNWVEVRKQVPRAKQYLEEEVIGRWFDDTLYILNDLKTKRNQYLLYYGTFLRLLDWIVEPAEATKLGVEIAAITELNNKILMVYNKGRLESTEMTMEQVRFVIMHECLHIQLQHFKIDQTSFVRRLNFPPSIYNIIYDAEINTYLTFMNKYFEYTNKMFDDIEPIDGIIFIDPKLYYGSIAKKIIENFQNPALKIKNPKTAVESRIEEAYKHAREKIEFNDTENANDFFNNNIRSLALYLLKELIDEGTTSIGYIKKDNFIQKYKSMCNSMDFSYLKLAKDYGVLGGLILNLAGTDNDMQKIKDHIIKMANKFTEQKRKIVATNLAFAIIEEPEIIDEREELIEVYEELLQKAKDRINNPQKQLVKDVYNILSKMYDIPLQVMKKGNTKEPISDLDTYFMRIKKDLEASEIQLLSKATGPEEVAKISNILNDIWDLFYSCFIFNRALECDLKKIVLGIPTGYKFSREASNEKEIPKELKDWIGEYVKNFSDFADEKLKELNIKAEGFYIRYIFPPFGIGGGKDQGEPPDRLPPLEGNVPIIDDPQKVEKELEKKKEKKDPSKGRGDEKAENVKYTEEDIEEKITSIFNEMTKSLMNNYRTLVKSQLTAPVIFEGKFEKKVEGAPPDIEVDTSGGLGDINRYVPVGGDVVVIAYNYIPGDVPTTYFGHLLVDISGSMGTDHVAIMKILFSHLRGYAKSSRMKAINLLTVQTDVSPTLFRIYNPVKMNPEESKIVAIYEGGGTVLNSTINLLYRVGKLETPEQIEEHLKKIKELVVDPIVKKRDPELAEQAQK
ncbi:MAG: hypothetical protein NZM44_04125, partial [Candidatus Calescibacterium sp.]|nr:hypothetical protein [Candidatus Calescibacterium sp.]